MLPSPTDLRDLALRLRRAVEKLTDPSARTRIAGHAFLLAQLAEQLERDIPAEAFVQNANIERYRRLLAEASDETTRATVAELLRSEQGNIRRKAEEIKLWRMRSEELRTVADQCLVPSAKDILLRAAANYDRLADNAEERISGYGSHSDEVA